MRLVFEAIGISVVAILIAVALFFAVGFLRWVWFWRFGEGAKRVARNDL